jgi:hypothetical protein
MGWLPMLRKHKGDEHPESKSVQAAGKSGDPSGAGVVGDPNQGVVTAGSGSVNVVHHTGPAPNLPSTPKPFPRSGQVVVGASYPTLKEKVHTCGHEPSVAIVAGCWPYLHVHAWMACHKCQMETLWQIRHGETDTYVACGHKIGDIIYSYLPNDPEYHALGRKMFTAHGTLADDHP